MTLADAPVRAAGRDPVTTPRGVHLCVVGALALVAGFKRRLGLDAPALYFDDVWVAVSSLKGRWYEVADHGLTAGGFTLLVRPPLHLFGDVGGKLVPFAVGVVTPAVLYLVLVERRIRWPVAAAAGALLAASPMHARQSFAVKQYTIDGLIAVLVLWIAWRLIEDGHRRGRWTALLLLATVGVVLSFQTAAVSVVAILVAGVHGLRNGADRRWLLSSAAVTAVVCGAWYGLVVRPNVSDGLAGHWVLAYIYLDDGWRRFVDSARAVSTHLVGGLVDVDHLLVRVGVVASAIYVLLRRGAVGLLVVGPLVVGALLAAAHQAPLGGGRTDLGYYPSILFMLAIAVDALADRLERVAPRAGTTVGLASLAAASLLLVTMSPPRYLAEEQRQLIEELEASRAPGEQVLVLGLGQYAYGYYSGGPVEIVEDDVLQTGFDVRVSDPDVVLLPDIYCCAEELPVAARAAVAGRDVVWLVGPPATGVAAVRSVLEEEGFQLEVAEEGAGALLERWSRT